MSKIDKSKYSKHEFRRLQRQKKSKKEKFKSGSQVAFILGNGVSRKPIPPESLKPLGTIYGCNALYREIAPHHLICVDPKMVYEIANSGYQNRYTVWTNPNRSFDKIGNLNYIEPKLGWSSGPTALYLSCQHQHSEIYILGFDYKGLNDGKKLNNIYADTKNYKKSRDRATFYGNWLRQTIKVIDKNPTINFYRVIQKNDFRSDDLNNLRNLQHVYIEDFKKYFNID